MKIIVLGSGVPSVSYPLLGSFAFGQAKALAEDGHDVTYFALDLRSFFRRRAFGISNGVESNGLKWYIISIPIGAIPIGLLCRIGGYAFSILYRRVFKAEKPDIIHAHFMEIGCMASSLAKKNKIPLIITEHSSIMNRSVLPRGFKKCAEKAYNNASAVIAVSEKLANNIKELTGINCAVIPNMINTSVFSKADTTEHKGFRLVTTSNLIPLKRTIDLIKSVELLSTNYPDISLDIIGDGFLKNELKQYVDTHGLSKRVLFHGYLPSEQIAKIYSISDCFALVSSTETFGVVYVEALASGLPVIATRCGGPEDFINNNNGLLIEVEDLQALQSAIIYMYKHATDYPKETLKQFAVDSFSPHAIVKRLVSLYQKFI